MEYDNPRANVAQVKEHLSSYIAMVEQGKRVVVCRRNKPVAELVAVEQAPAENRTRLGSDKNSVIIKTDLTDSVLPEIAPDLPT